MIKIYCDICGEEPQEEDFTCELITQQITVDISNNLPSPKNKLNKLNYQICKTCFGKHISKLFQDGKEEKK